MSTKEARNRAVMKYDKNHYDKLLIRVKKGDKDRILEKIKDTNDSINSFVNKLILQALNE